MRRINSLVLLIVTASCSSSNPSGPSTAADFAVESGQGQSGIVGEQLAKPLVVKVTDAHGNPVRGQAVNFIVTAGGGSVFGGAETTDRSGIAQELWTLGTSTADSQRVEARAVDPSTGKALTFGVFDATPLAAAPASLSIVAGNNESAAAGAPLPDSVAVKGRDKYGNLTPGISVNWNATGGGGSVSPNVSPTNAAGIAKAQWTMGPRRGANALVAKIGTVSVSFAAAASVGPPALMTKVSGDNASLNTGDTNRVAVRVTDAAGDPASAVVTFTVTSGTGYVATAEVGQNAFFAYSSLFPQTVTDTVSTDSTGTASMLWELGPGANVVTASAGAARTTFSATAAAPFTATSITGNNATTCAIASGNVYCWGFNAVGELGRGPAATGVAPSCICAIQPAAVAGSQTFTSATVSKQNHFLSNWAYPTLDSTFVCALTSDGSAECWGSGLSGALGPGGGEVQVPTGGTFPTSSSTPVPVAGGLHFTSIAAGGFTSCGLDASGKAYCWGRDTFGQTGDSVTLLADTTISILQLTPVAVAGGHTFTSLALGQDFACALATGGTVYCWGRNDNGQLGDGTRTIRTVPVPIATSTHFVSLSATAGGACALASGGTAYCWGLNASWTSASWGVVSNLGSTTPLAAPGVTLSALLPATSYFCGLDVSGSLYCWDAYVGRLDYREQGPYTSPTLINTGIGSLAFRSVTLAGDGVLCGLTQSGAAYCLGANNDGQLGHGEIGPNTQPGYASPTPLPMLGTGYPIGVAALNFVQAASPHVVSRPRAPRRK